MDAPTAKKPEDGAMAATAWLEVEINPESPTPGTALILQIAFNTKGNKDKQPLPDVANISRAKFLRRHYEDPDPNAPKRVFCMSDDSLFHRHFKKAMLSSHLH